MPRRGAATLEPVPTTNGRAGNARNGKRTQVVTAAARQINLNRAEEVRRARAHKENWQSLAWDFYDAIGEVKEGVGWKANMLSKLRLFPAVWESGADEPVETEDPAAVASVDRLRGATGGHAELVRELVVQLSVPGQGYLIGLAERAENPTTVPPTPFRPERWFIASTDEVEIKNGGEAWVDDPDTGEKVRLRGSDTVGVGEEADFWGRIWRRHPRHSARCDSALRGILDPCEELLIVDRAFRSLARSRIAMGKIVYVPDDISFGNTDPTTDSAGDGEAYDDPFNEEMMEAFTTPILDEGSAAAVSPIVLRGPRNPEGGGSGIEVIDIERSAHEQLQDRATHAIRRIAQGLNQPVELTFGLGEANHWGAGQIERQAFESYLEPDAVLVVDGLTTAYHRAALIDAGMDAATAARHVIWFDASTVTRDPVAAEAANDGWDRYMISDEAWRRARGFGPDDAPLAEEVEARRRLPVLNDPRRRGNDDPTAAPPPVAAAAVHRHAIDPSELGARLVDIDVALRARLEGAADTVVRDALRKVGNRIVSKARRDPALAAALEGVAPEAVVATLGRSVTDGLEDPAATIEGVVNGLAPRFSRWTSTAQRQALNLVEGLSSSQRAAAEAAQATDRVDAWQWFAARLAAVVVDRLYDPSPEPAPDGEHDPDVVVPYAVVREAVARAGGCHREAHIEAAVFDRALAVMVGFGIGVGYVIRRALAALGRPVSTWTWRYGTLPRRPFEPHRRLDGIEFSGPGDGVLVNRAPFPPVSFYAPGDHPGCRCEAVPTFGLIRGNRDDRQQEERAA